MNEHDTARLSAYLDGDLEPAARAAVEEHAASCDHCATTLAVLRSIAVDAANLPPLDPPAHLWPAIQGRLRPRRAAPERPARDQGDEGTLVPLRRPRRRIAFTVPQLLAAGLALMILPAAAVWLALATGPEAAQPAAARPAETASTSVLASYEPVIDQLEREFELRRDLLEPATILVVERNLAIIDQAITEARLALEADPSSGFLQAHLASTMRRKADLLRQAASIGRTDT